MVRGVLFDAGNTLLRVRGSVGLVYDAVARRHGVYADPERLEQVFRSEFAARRGSFLPAVARPHSAQREFTWWQGLVSAVFAEVGALDGFCGRFPEFFAELYQEFARPDHWQVFPDVAPCLDDLDQRGLPCAVVSNWDSRLHPVLDGLGLAGRFRFVLTSAEFGAEKPHPSIFREGARRLGAAPAEVLHVGDLLADDVRGAREAGLQAVWLRRGGPSPGATSIASLAELPKFLENGSFPVDPWSAGEE